MIKPNTFTTGYLSNGAVVAVAVTAAVYVASVQYAGYTASQNIVKDELLLKASKAKFEGTDNLVNVTAGKNFKDHFIRHKKLLENLFGTKYPKFKKDGARFLDDIGRAINEGHVKFVGNAKLRDVNTVYKVYRGNEVTISTLQNGEWHKMLESFKGMYNEWMFIP